MYVKPVVQVAFDPVRREIPDQGGFGCVTPKLFN